MRLPTIRLCSRFPAVTLTALLLATSCDGQSVERVQQQLSAPGQRDPGFPGGEVVPDNAYGPPVAAPQIDPAYMKLQDNYVAQWKALQQSVDSNSRGGVVKMEQERAELKAAIFDDKDGAK